MLPETPRFWADKGTLSNLLTPASWIYGLCRKIDSARIEPYKSKIPVICIGGVVAGGSGKTPVVHAILTLLVESGLFERPVILTRGYGGVLRGPSRVDPDRHTYLDVGDEALLHARRAPTIVSKNRASGARLAEAMGADVILMDDGLQNNGLHKTLSFLVMDTVYGIGNGRLLPAGPLREPFADALKKVSGIIGTNGKTAPETDKEFFPTSLSITSEHDHKRRHVGFAGLGHPDKFKSTLIQNGFRLSDFKSFPDHYPYKTADMQLLTRHAGSDLLITTEKDHVRLPAAYANSIQALTIELSFDEPDRMLAQIRSGLNIR